MCVFCCSSISSTFSVIIRCYLDSEREKRVLSIIRSSHGDVGNLPPSSSPTPAIQPRGQRSHHPLRTVPQVNKVKIHFKKLNLELQKDREDEKAEGYVPDEGTRKNPRKTTK